MTYCRQCGAKLPQDEEAKFCPNCGAPLQAPSRILRPVEVPRKIEKAPRRAGSIILAIVICFIVTGFGAVLPIDPEEAQGTSGEFSELEKLFREASPFLRVALIYGNNLFHSLVMFTPFVGPFYGLYVLFSTGRVIAAVAFTEGVNPFSLLIYTFIFPHAWFEYVAYGIALSESFWFTLMILRRRFREELANVFKAISVCALLLLFAALIETYLISSLA